jgi:predicted adenylyl cyclase CyaB
MPYRNFELKARNPDLAAAHSAVSRLGARPAGVEFQTDTYFPVAHGRLKLREIEGKPAVLIAYDRPDRSEARLSAYHLVPVVDAPVLKAALAAALGVRGQVQKRRDIYLWHNVRIHLDEVAGLGTFIEVEAVLSSDEDEIQAPSRLAQLCHELAILPANRVASSYAELLGF